MILEELKAAVEKFHDGTNTSYDIYGPEIAEALTDPTPIFREAMEGLGFAETGAKSATSEWLKLGAVNAYRIRDAAWTFFLYDQPHNFAKPQPQTLGDLLGLLLQLGRKGE